MVDQRPDVDQPLAQQLDGDAEVVDVLALDAEHGDFVLVDQIVIDAEAVRRVRRREQHHFARLGHQLESQLVDAAAAHRGHDRVCTPATSKPFDLRNNVARRRVEHDIGAQAARLLAAALVQLAHDHPRPAPLQNQHVQHAHRTGPDDDYVVAQFRLQGADAVHDAAHRLGQRRLFHAQLIRYRKQRAGRNQLVLGQAPRAPRAVERKATQPLLAARRIAAPTVVALAAVDRTQRHPIADAAQANGVLMSWMPW